MKLQRISASEPAAPTKPKEKPNTDEPGTAPLPAAPPPAKPQHEPDETPKWVPAPGICPRVEF